MTKETLAEKLNGRQYGEEITKEEKAIAKENNLVVVFGYSDDNVELRGAIFEEIGAYGGTELYITKDGLLCQHDDRCECAFCGYSRAKENARKITAVWDKDGYSWIFETDIPHCTFEIMEDNEKFCRGIVFEMPVENDIEFKEDMPIGKRFV